MVHLSSAQSSAHSFIQSMDFAMDIIPLIHALLPSKTEACYTDMLNLIIKCSKDQGPYSPTILKNILSLFLQDTNWNVTQLLIG